MKQKTGYEERDGFVFKIMVHQITMNFQNFNCLKLPKSKSSTPSRNRSKKFTCEGLKIFDFKTSEFGLILKVYKTDIHRNRYDRNHWTGIKALKNRSQVNKGIFNGNKKWD